MSKSNGQVTDNTLLSQFQQDVLNGLSASPKFLSSKYFYDARGSVLFEQIMRMPEYYPTDCEFEIFETHKQALLEEFSQFGAPFRLIDFGAGDGLKTKILLDHFLEQEVSFSYTTVDISGDALQQLCSELAVSHPELDVSPIEGDYFVALDQLNETDKLPKVIMFLGSNIGNFLEDQAIFFLQNLQQRMNEKDTLMVGLDLKKDPQVILHAYNDDSGITKEFNLNLLRRLNRELGANFNVDQFIHAPTYNPMTGETKSYLVSTCEQEVYIGKLDTTFQFFPWEAIWTELSQKYDFGMIQHLADKSGFRVDNHYQDKRNYFVDSILRPR
ncbi:MAG: L-histidine N(alpha)-methyltransferase [Bacteroidota bacterium]